MHYQYFICDVFTDVMFSGNPLAVVPYASGLSDEQMQNIAREFNFSETTFVLPAQQGHTRQVRIFTPTREIPFAGHPNIGTAFVLAEIGQFGGFDGPMEVVFEEIAGSVAIAIDRNDHGYTRCELKAPGAFWIGQTVSADVVAAILNLSVTDIVTDTHEPQEASVGLEFLCVEIASLQALQQAKVSVDRLSALVCSGVAPDIHLYWRGCNDVDLRVRMFAPLDGVPEDAATGSANCALIALLSYYDNASSNTYSWCISQGTEMGRPSELFGRTKKQNGSVTDVWIAGDCVLIGEGTLFLS
ncbi:MAG: PhzF family phenazine biosynthesis protein [Porticoccaceae bacterium]|nr:PhzF family phenazine biosynthesis protein [Porticoccaceae bacterium]